MVTATSESDIDRVAEIERLAALDPVDYDVARDGAAKRLGIRAATLDAEVKKKRKALGLDKAEADEGQGRAVNIPDVVPWPDPVDGDMLATMLACAIKTHIVLPDSAADAVALWVLHTYLVNEFAVSPRLAIYSPTKGCGKTTLLGVLSKLVRKPKFTGSISPAAMFRLVEQHQPTLLIDELKKFLELGSELHALLNEGHGRGVNVLRVLGEKLELREFRVFGAIAFGTLGRVPDDLEDRSIIIKLQRRRPDEEIRSFRVDRAGHLEVLARKAARWAEDHAAEVAEVDPEPPGLTNRTADNWRPLFAIAEHLGGDWPANVTAAAAALADQDDESTAIMLFTDIRAMFAAEDTDRLASATICTKLADIEGRPWAEWKNGKPITPNQLARLLKPFVIISETMRVAGGMAKGYHLHRFGDAFARYFPPDTPSEPVTTSQPAWNGHFSHFQSVTPDQDVTDRKSQKAPSNGHCYAVTPQKRDDGLCACCHRPADDGQPLLDVAVAGLAIQLHPTCISAWQADHTGDAA